MLGLGCAVCCLPGPSQAILLVNSSSHFSSSLATDAARDSPELWDLSSGVKSPQAGGQGGSAVGVSREGRVRCSTLPCLFLLLSWLPHLEPACSHCLPCHSCFLGKKSALPHLHFRMYQDVLSVGSIYLPCCGRRGFVPRILNFKGTQLSFQNLL